MERAGGGKETRKAAEQRLREALAERGFRRQRSKDRFLTEEWTQAPLQALLLAGMDVDRQGTVRLGGAMVIIVPQVEALFASVPMAALSVAQEIYAGQLPYSVASAAFRRLEPPGSPRPEWRATSEEEVPSQVDGFVAYVDGPVREWVRRHDSVDAVRAAADDRRGEPNDGAVVRTVAALEVLTGHRDVAFARLERYRSSPTGEDTVERVEAFVAWLAQTVPAQ